MNKLKIVGISDTHNRHESIKELNGDLALGGDIIIHAGDATGGGSLREVKSFLKWYGDLDFSHRILIAGNHDWLFETSPTLVQDMCDEYGITLLNDSSVTIEGVKIHGSPVQPFFHAWAFNRARSIHEAQYYNIKEIKPHWDMIPDDVDILVTHGPSYMMLDELVYVNGDPKGQYVGCVKLSERIRELKQLKYHMFGHIHFWGGTSVMKDGVTYHNLSVCDECYVPTNPITIIEYDKELK
jgi:Icc-related predicted phosphoesterase